MPQGNLKWYDIGKCYGFIASVDKGEDVFFHKTAIIDLMSIKRICDCARRGTPILLSYELDKTKDRRCAKWVQAI